MPKGKPIFYRVKRGDTLERISSLFRAPIPSILRDNPGVYRPVPGSTLKVSSRAAPIGTRRTGESPYVNPYEGKNVTIGGAPVTRESEAQRFPSLNPPKINPLTYGMPEEAKRFAPPPPPAPAYPRFERPTGAGRDIGLAELGSMAQQAGLPPQINVSGLSDEEKGVLVQSGVYTPDPNNPNIMRFNGNPLPQPAPSRYYYGRGKDKWAASDVWAAKWARRKRPGVSFENVRWGGVESDRDWRL